MYCQEAAHVQSSECGAPEFYSGAKLTLVPGTPDGRIDLDTLTKMISVAPKVPHAGKHIAHIPHHSAA
jgi:threonine aldolase